MARFYKKRKSKKGLPPGALIFIGDQRMDSVQISLMDYGPDHLEEKEMNNLSDAVAYAEKDSVTWINIDGLHDQEIVDQAGKIFDIHPLFLEDIMNTGQRAKFDDIDDTLFASMKMVRSEGQRSKVISEQLTLIIYKKYILSFQEVTGDVFDPVRERIRQARGRIRSSGTDYLAYALIDSVIDNYTFLIEELGERIENIELEILEDPKPSVLDKINELKRELNFLSKVARPIKELLVGLIRSESHLLQKKNKPYFRDVLDLHVQAIETIDSYRSMLSDFLNVYHTGISNRLNDIMKVLTIFSAIFIPLTFVAGIYGTNFDYLPELHWKYSYLVFWIVLLMIGAGMLWFFRRRKWL